MSTGSDYFLIRSLILAGRLTLSTEMRLSKANSAFHVGAFLVQNLEPCLKIIRLHFGSKYIC